MFESRTVTSLVAAPSDVCSKDCRFLIDKQKEKQLRQPDISQHSLWHHLTTHYEVLFSTYDVLRNCLQILDNSKV